MTTKIAQLRQKMTGNDWIGIRRIATRFPRLGEHQDAITAAWAALQHPEFYRQIGKDSDALVSPYRSNRYATVNDLPQIITGSIRDRGKRVLAHALSIIALAAF